MARRAIYIEERVLLCFTLIAVLILGCETREKRKNRAVENKKEILVKDLKGIWQLVSDKAIVKGNMASYPFHSTFIYDDKTVTIYLVSLSDFYRKSEDDIYRLSARFEKDTLSYILPYRDKWIKLAYLKNGVFYSMDMEYEWQYQKVTPAEVPSWHKKMLRPGRPVIH